MSFRERAPAPSGKQRKRKKGEPPPQDADRRQLDYELWITRERASIPDD